MAVTEIERQVLEAFKGGTSRAKLTTDLVSRPLVLKSIEESEAAERRAAISEVYGEIDSPLEAFAVKATGAERKRDADEPGESTEETDDLPEFSVINFNMADVDRSILDRQRAWLWGEVLGPGDIMAITGLSGSGKTLTVAEISGGAASGGEVLGRAFKRKLRVKVFDPEFEETDIQQRIMRVLEKTNSLEYSHNIDVSCSKYAPLDLKGIAGVLADDRSKGKEYDLIILDSIFITLALEDLDENNNAHVTVFLVGLRQICARFGVVCVFMLHPPKNAGQAAQNAGMLARGAEAWRAGVDVMAEFRPLKIEEGSGAWELQKSYARETVNEFGQREKRYPDAFRFTFVKWRHGYRPRDMNVFLRYPLHEVDMTGELAECRENFNTPQAKGGESTKQNAKQRRKAEEDALADIVSELENESTVPNSETVARRLNQWRKDNGISRAISAETLERYATEGKKRKYFSVECVDGVFVRAAGYGTDDS